MRASVPGHADAGPDRVLLRAGGACLVLALIATALVSRTADWEPVGLFATVLGLAVASDLLEATTKSLRISGSFLAIVLAMALLGPAPAVVVALVTTLGRIARVRPRPAIAVCDLAACAIFPLAGGLLIRFLVDVTDAPPDGTAFLVIVLAAFLAANLLNFLLIALASWRLDGVSPVRRLATDFAPVLPWELVTGLLTVAVVSVYQLVGVPALVLAAAVVLTFQFLLRELLASQRRSEELESRNTQLRALQVGVLAAMVQTLGLRDRMTARHSAAVARFAREIAATAGRSEREQEIVHTAGLLHDIGKFALPDTILLGHGELTEDDWTAIRRHPEDGARVVRRVDGYGPVADIILLHHERLDGRGYPYGLAGDEIPLFARIVAVADAYDVMTARDSYRASMSPADACAELRRHAGTQFDPWVVETFISLLERREVAFRHADDADFERELGFERRVRDVTPSSPG